MIEDAGARQTPPAVVAPGTTAEPSVVCAWVARHSLVVFLALVAVGSLRIVGTYTVLSHTFDEPAHIACGMEWLKQGVYRYETLHPPLARVAAAIGPALAGSRSHGEPEMSAEGLAILYAGGHYDRTLALARLGILPFFWLASLVVYLWAKKYFGEPNAALAVLMFTSLPPILAHAGLATTDMAATATIGAAFLAAVHWCERPTLGRSLVFGAAAGLAVLSKFSALAFLPVALAGALLCHLLVDRLGVRRLIRSAGVRLPTVCLAMLTTFYVIWAGYRFSFGHVGFTTLRLPFPELYSGIQEVTLHSLLGAPTAYLFGEHRETGWWYYYFVVLAVKTPLAFLVLTACGAAAASCRGCPRGLWLALAFCASILVFCMFSRINLGVRHVLCLYEGFSIAAAAGAVALFKRARSWRPAGWLATGLLLWLTASSALAHPDYLAYFNELAGAEPERVLVDSDLEWGQDMKRLSRRLRELGVRQVAFGAYLPSELQNIADLQKLGFPLVTPFRVWQPTPGWNAMNVSILQLMLAELQAQRPDLHFWTEATRPTEKVGSGILLWYIPPDSPLLHLYVKPPPEPVWMPPNAPAS
jgi:4-amino-4-deoxy-L-arabinose transferase-like glycosyltransferase